MDGDGEVILYCEGGGQGARIGRLRERYATIARFYNIEVGEETLEARLSGAYYIRSSRTDLADIKFSHGSF